MDLDKTKPVIMIVMGSDSDLSLMQQSAEILKKFNIPFTMTIASAHRTPSVTEKLAKEAEDRGIEVIIAGAGAAAHLAGVIASHTTLPVIGVPIDSSPLSGFDALLSTVQMPPGVPVAAMAVGRGGARNGALFAIQILARKYPEVNRLLKDYKEKMAQDVIKKAEEEFIPHMS
jgi:phosphoribosylaminoimidazole carboxylase PurE protein